MTNKGLFDIERVQETNSQDEANDMLKRGWKLINIYTSSYSFEENVQTNIYVLGKPHA